jgi:hypothetical protein
MCIFECHYEQYYSGSRRLIQGWIKYAVAVPYLENNGNKAAFWTCTAVENMHN